MATALATLTPATAMSLAREAYIFGLPLVYVATQIDQETHVSAPIGTRAPLNQLAFHRDIAEADSGEAAAFNVDMLSITAKLDLSSGPLVLSVPPMEGRFWIAQLADAWGNIVTTPGAHSVPDAGAYLAILGPDAGEPLTGMTPIRVDTALATLAVRIHAVGHDDYAAARALQHRFRLLPMDAWAHAYHEPPLVGLKPGVDDKTSAAAQVMEMTGSAFFCRLNQLLATNPPSTDDAELLARFATLGIVPGAEFVTDALDADIRDAIDEGVAVAQQLVRDAHPAAGTPINGWSIAHELHDDATAPLARAARVFFGVGDLAADDAYAFSVADADGVPYDVLNRYVLHFAEGELLPASALWSITMYDGQSCLVPNRINRYAISSRSGLKHDADGGLSLHIQSHSPGKSRESNWLPTPAQGDFQLAFRLYSPSADLMNGAWLPPGVERVSDKKRQPGQLRVRRRRATPAGTEH